MDNSIKVKINYHPVNFMQIALWIMILLAVPCFWLASYSDSFSLLLLGLVAVILTDVVAGVLSSAKAVVYANDEKLCRRYLNKDSVIMLSDVTEISYSVCIEHHGRYAEQRLLLTIKTNDGTVHQLNDSLSTESFVAALDADGETNIPLIQLYRFLAERLPDKAKGYVKQEKNEADI